MSTVEPSSIAELQAQIAELQAALTIANGQIQQLLAARPAVASLELFRANLQQVAQQALQATMQTNAKLLENLTPVLATNQEEQTVLMAMRTNGPFRGSVVTQAKSLLNMQ